MLDLDRPGKSLRPAACPGPGIGPLVVRERRPRGSVRDRQATDRHIATHGRSEPSGPRYIATVSLGHHGWPTMTNGSTKGSTGAIVVAASNADTSATAAGE
jgi:hypothetical protein